MKKEDSKMKKRNIAMICAVAMAAGIMTPASVAMAEEKADLKNRCMSGIQR